VVITPTFLIKGLKHGLESPPMATFPRIRQMAPQSLVLSRCPWSADAAQPKRINGRRETTRLKFL